MNHRFAWSVSVIATVLLLAPATQAWNFAGHRMVAMLALERLPSDMPAFLQEPGIRRRIAEQSSEPDRWRGLRNNALLSHENAPDHFIDVEDLEQFGLTLRTIPKERIDYIVAMATSAAQHPEKLRPYDAAKDWDKTKRWPGFAQHAILEHYNKLWSSFNTYRIMEELIKAGRANPEWLEQPRENIIYHMGMLSHFVGDIAQPLHTTRHYNGWIGDNPNGYTTDKGFHSFIDGGLIDRMKIDEAVVRPVLASRTETILDPKDPWNEIMVHIERSFAKMEPLYQLQKSGELTSETGKQFIAECLADGASMLGAMYASAWTASAPTDDQVANMLRTMPFVTTPITISAPKKGDSGDKGSTNGAK